VPSSGDTPSAPTVVLVGAGHTHALVIERWAKEPPAGVDLLVVTDRVEVVYSGMIPGRIAREYRPEETLIDAARLTRRAGGRLLEASVTSVDAEARRLDLESGDSLEYDVASLDIGSRPAGLDPVTVDSVVVPARAVERLEARLETLEARPAAPEVVVVGGGAGGVELAAAMGARFERVSLLEDGDRLMAAYHPRVSRRVLRALEERGVDVVLDAGERLDADLVVWATGASAPPLLRRSGLPVDEEGFVRIDRTLRVVGRGDLFAAGDCASVEGESLPKAGVHAVRQAPVLFENLARTVEARRSGGPARVGRRRSGGRGFAGGDAPRGEADPELRRYRPQSDFLTLLNLGDGTALGTKWGLAVEGRWVRWLKDAIDRRFVERFRA